MAATDEAVVLHVGEMIDLAIGTPEVGVVDFGMLHTVLHCLAQQLRVLNKPVELRGNVGALPIGRDFPQTITITEHLVDTDGKVISGGAVEPSTGIQTSMQPDSIQTGPMTTSPNQPDSISIGPMTSTSKQPESILIVERARKPESQERKKLISQDERKKLLTQAKPQRSPSSHSHKTDSTAPQVSESTEKLSLVTTSKFNILENIVEDLRERVYGSIPKNEDILEEVRSQTNLKSITDMWTSLNVSSRLEAAEAGIAKLSSLIQDLISDTGSLQDAFKKHSSETFEKDATEHPDHEQLAETAINESSEPHQGITEETVTYTAADPHTGSVTQKTTTPKATAAPKSISQSAKHHTVTDAPTAMLRPAHAHTSAHFSELAPVVAFLKQLQNDFDKLRDDFYKAMADLKPEMERPEHAPMPPLPALTSEPATLAFPTETKEPTLSITETGDPTFEATTVTEKPTHETITISEPTFPGATTGAEQVQKPEKRVILGPEKAISLSDITRRLNEIEKKLKEFCESANKQDGVVHDHINSFQDQLEYLSRQVASTQEFTGSKLSQDIAKDLPGLMKLFQTVQAMQEELKQVHETALQLAAEKEDRQDRINAIIEQIEVLKTIKLDREDMAEAIAEKADLRMLARKVSHDQFELACDDLSRGLDHALGKLDMQEALWQQALDDIQREIETKLDKMELSPVKDFFNNKLKQLQENLKHIASLRREVEAAGAKKKLMRDLNCLSCDAKVVMQMDQESTLPVSKPLPANLSMKPYLSYELDTIRKTQASNLPQRNLHDWEHIDKQAQPLKMQQKVRSETDKHLCNRYCGGSHTLTTPAQRVARVGHFIKQWGPDVLPLSTGYTTGEDGRMYKISPPEGNDATTAGTVDSSCSPQVPTKKGDQKISEKRTNIVNAECRCLEEGKTTHSKSEHNSK